MKLHTYSITDFNNNYILVEFVPNTISLNKALIDELDNLGLKLECKERSVFHMKFNVLWKFYHRNFKSSSSWLEAIINYETSVAIWSMAGYLIGLGDRHLENTLLNVKDGK